MIQAREAGRLSNRWLLVNVQNTQEFQCQMLNRDVWSNIGVKEIVRDGFILWQVNVYHGNVVCNLFFCLGNLYSWAMSTFFLIVTCMCVALSISINIAYPLTRLLA